MIKLLSITLQAIHLHHFLQEVPEESYSLPYHNNQTTNSANGDVMLKIDPVPLREEQKFPQEKWKTFIGNALYAERIIYFN